MTIAHKRTTLYAPYTEKPKFKTMLKIINQNVKNNMRIHAQKLLALDKVYIARPPIKRPPSWGASSSVALKQRAYQSKRLKTDTRQKLCSNGSDNTKSVMRQGIERANQKG